MIPREGLAWFEQARPARARAAVESPPRSHAWLLREAYGCTVHCIRNGVHELDGRGPVEPFEFGDQLPGGVIVYEVDAICPDETALHIPRTGRWPAPTAWCAGRWRRLAFVPDPLMDDPERTKQGLRAAYRRLLELDFDLLLLAHGDPSSAGARLRSERSSTARVLGGCWFRLRLRRGLRIRIWVRGRCRGRTGHRRSRRRARGRWWQCRCRRGGRRALRRRGLADVPRAAETLDALAVALPF